MSSTKAELYLDAEGGSSSQYRRLLREGKTPGEAFWESLSDPDQRILQNDGIELYLPGQGSWVNVDEALVLLVEDKTR